MQRRLQNKIAESTWTLPIVSVFVALCWLLPFGHRWEEPVGLGVCVLTTYVLLELNTANALLRVRSRMVSVVYLLLVCLCGWLHVFNLTCLAALCIVLSFYTLFQTYEQVEAVFPTFHAYLFIALASLVWPPLLWLALIQWWNQTIFLRSMSWRGLWAAILGAFTPYFFWSCAVLTVTFVIPFLPGIQVESLSVPTWLGMPQLLSHLHGIVGHPVQFVHTIQAGQVPLADVWLGLNQELVDADRDVLVVLQAHTPWLMSHLYKLCVTAYAGLLGLTGFVHYLRKNYDDRISVRMCHYSFLLMESAVCVWMLLSPGAYSELFPLLLLLMAPSVAHFFTLTRTWLTNAWFVLCTLAWVALLLFPFYYPIVSANP